MKAHIRAILLYILLFLSTDFSLYAQQVIVNPIPFLDKLPTNSIFNLYQDKKGFIWVGTAYGLERYDGYDVQPFINSYKSPNKLTSNDVRCFTEDNEYLWIGTAQGISIMNNFTYQVTQFPDSTLQNKEIRDLFYDWRENVWVAADKSLFRCDARLGILKKYSLKGDPNTFFEDNNGDLWFLTWNGDILKYDNLKDSFVEYAHMEGSSPYRMIQDKQGKYWIATWGNGIWRFNPHSKDKNEMFHQQRTVNPIRHSPEQVFYDLVQDDTYGYLWALSHFRLYVFRVNEQDQLEEVDINAMKNINQPIDQYKTYSRIIKDRSGNLWLGAYDQGYTITFEKAEIVNYTMENIKKELGVDANILYFNKDSKGVIWFDQSRYGLCLFDEQTGITTYGKSTNALYSIVVGSIAPSQKEDAVWLGGRNDFATKIWKTRQTQMRISILEEYDLKDITPSPGAITQLVEDNHGNIWIGTTTHLFFKPADSIKITELPFAISHISDIAKDNNGNVWICCQEDIYQMAYEDKPTILKHYSKEAIPLHKDPIKKISADTRAVWFSSASGRLFRLDLKEQKTTEQTNECGMEGNNILKILSHDNKVWIVGDKYVICHDWTQKTNTSYSVNDANIFVSSFRHSAAFVDKEGCLYAGGHNGFIKILPDSQNRKQQTNEQVFVTDVKCDNRSVLISPMEAEIGNSTSHVTLLPDARNVEISFSALSYISNRRVKYAYRMEGVDKNWTYIDNGKHSAFYNNLGKGEYTLYIRATDAYGNWLDKEQQMTIHCLPAWHETWYANSLYAFFALLFVFLLFRAYFRRMKLKNKMKLQEELSQIKLNYFTNISHELLTPLSIISCVTDDLEENKDNQERQLEILRNNTGRLRRLLQQVLDFRKIESGKMKLNVSKSNISSFVEGIVTSNFQALADKKSICLTTQIESNIWGYVDIDKLDKVLFNLLSNAIKYTPSQKNIKVSINTIYKETSRYLILKVEDEGIGITEKDIKQIFTRFYNNRKDPAYQSNGIGLSLTKELIALHHGNIEVSSKVDKGSLFTVELPIDKEIYNKQELADCPSDTSQEETTKLPEQENKPCILFIDDNKDLLELMYHFYSKRYHVLTADSAPKGSEVLRSNPVDIIICDVMMPQINGLEFCRQVKNDLYTSHIPIIMLTASNLSENQIESYKAGAESYITKPFEMKILQARIDNLLQARTQYQQSFRSKMEVDISGLDSLKPDEQFLNDAIQCVKQHMQESDFDLVQMAAELNISRSTLSRKFKVITGCTPLDFIRNIKLKYACSLLKDKSVNISDVAYATGFSTPKYFTKCFKEEFGMTPTEYQNQ